MSERSHRIAPFATVEHVENERSRMEEQLASPRAEIARLEAKLERYLQDSCGGSRNTS